MIYRTAVEKETVEATIKLSTEEYKEAITEYIVKYKLLPEGVDVTKIHIDEWETTNSKIKPVITYGKELVKLFP